MQKGNSNKLSANYLHIPMGNEVFQKNLLTDQRLNSIVSPV